MIIKDYLTPEGRELKPERRVKPRVTFPVRQRLLTAAERQHYGCDELQLPKRTCPCCGEEKSVYHFFPDFIAVGEMKKYCKRCWYLRNAERSEQRRARARKGGKKRDSGKQQCATANCN